MGSARRLIYLASLVAAAAATWLHLAAIEEGVGLILSAAPGGAGPDVKEMVDFLFFSTTCFLQDYLTFLFFLLWLARGRLARKGNVLGRLPKVSVIIPAYNEEETIGRTLESLLRQTYPKELMEIIVVDDGSEDSTYEVASSFGVKVVRHEGNRGKGAAIATGIKEAKGQIIVFVDADSVLEESAIGRLVNYLLSHKDTGAVAGAPLVANGDSGFWVKMQEIEYATASVFLKQVQESTDWLLVLPGTLSAYRAFLLKPFAEAKLDGLAEDFDLTVSVWKRGFRAGYEPRAVSWTRVPSNPSRLRRQRHRWYIGHLRVTAKHRNILMNKRFGMVGLMNYVFNFVNGFLIQSTSLLGHFVFLASLVMSYAFGVELLPLNLGPNLLALYLSYFIFSILPHQLINTFYLIKAGRRDLLLWSIPYSFFYTMWRAYLKTESLYMYMAGEKVGWK